MESIGNLHDKHTFDQEDIFYCSFLVFIPERIAIIATIIPEKIIQIFNIIIKISEHTLDQESVFIKCAFIRPFHLFSDFSGLIDFVHCQ